MERWCSWCNKKADHELVETNYVRRHIFQCTRCFNRTLKCMSCGEAMTRGHANWDDAYCSLCSKLIPEWGVPIPKEEGNCSWCFDYTEHELVQKNVLTRDVYECLNCQRRTLKCRKCGRAFARGHGTWDDELCIVCHGTYESWADARANPDRENIKEGWCSWCFTKSEHRLEQQNVIRRNVYSCQECFGRTIKCPVCDNGMAPGGIWWDDLTCYSCFPTSSMNWQKTHDAIEREINCEPVSEEEVKQAIIDRLSRNSPEKEKAFNAGLIRPFLYLVSMNILERHNVAMSLGMNIFTESNFDSHAQAWNILDKNIQGIIARATHGIERFNPLKDYPNWHQMMVRVINANFAGQKITELGFDGSIEFCKDPNFENVIFCLEKKFLDLVSKLQIAIQGNRNQDAVDRLEEDEEIKEIRRSLIEKGYSSDTVRYTLDTIYQVIRFGGFNSYILTVKIAAAMNRNLGTKIVMSQATKNVARVAAAANVIGWLWLAFDIGKLTLGSTLERLLPTFIPIVNQSITLSMYDIDITDFYKCNSMEMEKK